MQRSYRNVRSAFMVMLLILVACGRQTMPGSVRLPIGGNVDALAIVHTSGSHFWEYTLPLNGDQANQPRMMVNGPNNTLWFPPCYGPPKLYRLAAATGAVTTFTPPAIPSSYFAQPLLSEHSTCAIVSAGGYFWYTLIGRYGTCGVIRCYRLVSVEWLVRVTPSTGALALFGIGHGDGTPNISVDAYGKLWLILGSNLITNVTTAGNRGPNVSLPNGFVPIWIASGRDKNLYVTGSSFDGATNQLHGAVFRLSPVTGAVTLFATLPTFTGDLPAYCDLPGTGVGDVAVCAITADNVGNLWVTEPAFNEIAKITASGAVTQYHVPTANAWVTADANTGDVPMTPAFNGAVWFTEASASKIGRISTSGAFLQYVTPTPGLPSGLTACPIAVCGANGGVWIAENGAGRIARFDFP